MRFTTCLPLLLACTCGLWLPARAQDPPPAPAPTTIVAAADTFVLSLAPDRNHNHSRHPFLPAFSHGTFAQYETLIRFDLTGINGDVVNKATLQLFAQGCQGTCQVLHLPDADDPWGEATVTWTTRPTTGELVTTLAPPVEGIASVDVTAVVNAELASGRNRLISFRLLGATGGQVLFMARENPARAPRLVLE